MNNGICTNEILLIVLLTKGEHSAINWRNRINLTESNNTIFYKHHYAHLIQNLTHPLTKLVK